jgi:chromosome segregation ATPase
LDHLPASVREGDHHQVFTQLKSLQQENKSLKEKLERNLVETQNRQSNHVKWENELNSKLKNFREQVRELKTKLQSAETELQSIKQIDPENENISTGLNPEIELTRLNDLEDENIKLKDKVSELVKAMVEW